MRTLLWIAAIVMACSAFADEKTFTPTPPTRTPAQSDVEPVYEGNYQPSRSSMHGSQGLGVLVQGYYDALTPYMKTVASFAPQQFYSTTGTGFMGMQVMASYTVAHFEFQTGFDYIFQINEQGQQGLIGSFAVNSQTLNIMGLKALQVGYVFDFGRFALVPYGGLGIYYGRDVLQLTVSNQIDTVTFSKLMLMLSAGVRGDFVLNRNFSLNAGLELDQPVNFQTQLSQSGAIGPPAGELPGYEPYLQPTMDFMTSIGVRIVAGVKASF